MMLEVAIALSLGEGLYEYDAFLGSYASESGW